MEDFGGAFADACAAQPHAAQVLPAALWVHCAALHEGQDAPALPILDKAETITPEQQKFRELLWPGMVKAELAARERIERRADLDW